MLSLTETSHCYDINKLNALLSLISEILSVNDFHELLNKITEKTALLFNAEGSLVRLLTEDKQLKVIACYGLPNDHLEHLTMSLGTGIAGVSALQRRTIVINSKLDFEGITPILDIETAVNIPLIAEDKVIGTYGIFNKKSEDAQIIPFSSEDITLLEAFANISAIVIAKQKLFEDAIKQKEIATASLNAQQELKEYLEALIDSSADAIVTTDLNNIVRSWNKAAERIFGYTEEEIIGQPLPYVPDFLMEQNNEFVRRVINGETFKDIETVRKTKDSKLIDINLTLAPLKDSEGRVIAITRISRDISEKKRIERELLRRHSELNKLLFISSAMRGTLELKKLLKMVLTAVTMGDGLGFNRAMLFLLDESTKELKGAIGVGPASHEEAWRVWSELSMKQKSLSDILSDIETSDIEQESYVDKLCKSQSIPLSKESILTKTVLERRSFNITESHLNPLSDDFISRQLGSFAYATVPLLSKDKVIGVLWVDNYFSMRPITEHDIEVLKGFTNQISAAVENARLFEKIALAEKELENIFDSITDVLFVTDSSNIIKNANTPAMMLVSKPKEEIIGQDARMIFHDLFIDLKEADIKDSPSKIQEIDSGFFKGSFLVSCSPITNTAGELIGTVHILRDITEMKRLREKYIASQRMAVLGEMAAKVAHEIRNPLLSIGGFARRLEKRLESPLKEYAHVILQETTRLEGLLTEMLSFVKNVPLQKSEFMISQLITNVVNLMNEAAKEKSLAIVADIQEDILITADYNKLKEAIINVLSNAIQASEKGEVILRAYKKDTEAVIEVCDCGVGIKKEDLDKIFNPFFTTRATGTGLGLSITKKIVDDHLGKIVVGSQVGKGTTFSIYLPL